MKVGKINANIRRFEHFQKERLSKASFFVLLSPLPRQNLQKFLLQFYQYRLNHREKEPFKANLSNFSMFLFSSFHLQPNESSKFRKMPTKWRKEELSKMKRKDFSLDCLRDTACKRNGFNNELFSYQRGSED